MVEAFLHDDKELSLVPVERGMLKLMKEWRNDPRIRHVTREFGPLNKENQEQWFQRISAPDSRDFMFGVRGTVSLSPTNVVRNRLVGVVGLCHWSPRDRTAEVSFYIAPEWQGKQYARRALMLLHQWGFDELHLHRIFAEAYSDNDRSTELMKGLGYIQEGRLREHVFRKGKRVDSIMLGLLASEWGDR